MKQGLSIYGCGCTHSTMNLITLDYNLSHLFIIFITGYVVLEVAYFLHSLLFVSISTLIGHLFLSPNKIYYQHAGESELG